MHCQKRKSIISQVSQIFISVLLTTLFKKYLIWELFHLLSKALCFDISNYSYHWKYHKTFLIKPICELFIPFNDLFNNHDIKINTRWCNNNNAWRKLTIKYRKLQIHQGSTIDYFKCRYHLTLFNKSLFGAAHVRKS